MITLWPSFRWLHFFVDMFTITLDLHLVENNQTFSHGILACEGFFTFGKISFLLLERHGIDNTPRLTPTIFTVVVDTGMKVNGGYFLRDWFCVNSSSCDSSIGMWRIWRSKTVPCTATILSYSGTHNYSCQEGDISKYTYIFALS